MAMDDLRAHERRAQEGVLQFAEEMQMIREQTLYPRAGQKDAWKSYCQERWGMSESMVRKTIQAAPVLRRINDPARGRRMTDVHSACAVATLPEPVQDAILADAPKRDMVKARAKAARFAAKRGKDEAGQIKAAEKAKPSAKPPKSRAPMAPAEALQPVRDDPRDHGCKPRKLKRQAMHDNWRAYEALKDMVLKDDDAAAILRMVEQDRQILDRMEAVVSGEGQVTDKALAELLEEQA